MKLSKIQKVSLRVILLFTVAIFSTFVGDYLHDFLGDWKCAGSGKLVDYHYEGCNYRNYYHDAILHWGYRHWLYLIMCIILFIIQVVGIVSYIDSKEEKQ